MGVPDCQGRTSDPTSLAPEGGSCPSSHLGVLSRLCLVEDAQRAGCRAPVWGDAPRTLLEEFAKIKEWRCGPSGAIASGGTLPADSITLCAGARRSTRRSYSGALD